MLRMKKYPTLIIYLFILNVCVADWHWVLLPPKISLSHSKNECIMRQEKLKLHSSLECHQSVACSRQSMLFSLYFDSIPSQPQCMFKMLILLVCIFWDIWIFPSAHPTCGSHFPGALPMSLSRCDRVGTLGGLKCLMTIAYGMEAAPLFLDVLFACSIVGVWSEWHWASVTSPSYTLTLQTV